MKKDKNTADKFGGFIHTYAIARRCADEAVVPLLYEGRIVEQKVDREADRPLVRAHHHDTLPTSRKPT